MPNRRTILLVEDSPSLAQIYLTFLAKLNHRVLHAATGAAARQALAENAVDCLLLDLKLPDGDGIDILHETRTRPSPPAVIVVTATASLKTAIDAMRAGALDFLVKPFLQERLLTTVTNALAHTELRREVTTLRRTAKEPTFAEFIGRSLPMQTVYSTIEAAAPSNASVFITGESGTGKELAARALHQMSPRRANGFVALNCAAIPRDLLESMIFGHVKGAFTGATSDQEGVAAQVDQGTLFLDELGEMDPLLQSKLLRFVQTGQWQRVGDSKIRTANIRFVAATNRDPQQAVREGLLREDLFYRLAVVTLEMPPLRARGEDILLIARSLLKRFAEEEGKEFAGFAADAETQLIAAPWPGNVRQLQNAVRNAVVLNDGPLVTAAMLRLRNGTPSPEPAREIINAVPVVLPPMPAAIRPLDEVEQNYIEHAIALCAGNLQMAARKLGLSPSTIYRKREAWAKRG